VGVLADKARNVGRSLGALDNGTYREERIELSEHLLAAAETPDEPLDVVRHEPRVLPGVSLAVVVGAVRRGEGVERRAPASLRVAAPHEARRRIEAVAVRVAAFREVVRLLRPAQRLGGPCRGAVGQGVLHVVGHRLVEQVARDVAVLHPQAVAPIGVHGRLFDRLESFLPVESFDALHDGVRHDGNTRVAHHAVRFVAPQVPYRQAPLLVGDSQHRPHDVGHPLRMQDRHHRIAAR